MVQHLPQLVTLYSHILSMHIFELDFKIILRFLSFQ